MARRLFNGRRFSEDGWPYVDEGSCTWIVVPGTNPPVHLQIQNGPPLSLLGAWAADWNAYIEPLRDADSACWTPGNSVATSNHPGGTAVDLNWDSHKFQVRGTLNAAQMAVMAEMEDFYEGNVFWAGRWNSPVDEMHSQCGYDTYDQDADRPEPKVLDFIARKIRADGFSTFRRAGAPVPPPPLPASNAADVLARATGISIAKAQEILPTLQQGLALSEATNVNRIAMDLAQWGHESASFVYTEEIQSGDESTDRWLYKGRTWIQVTWKTNYAQFSQWAFSKGLVPTPTYFVDRPKELADLKWAALGPAWYTTVARPQLNSLADARNLVAVTQAINGGQNGAPDRKNRYDRALALGDQLLALTTNAPPTPGDDMAQVPQDQWDRVYRELTQKLPSRSPLRHLGEGVVDTMAGFVLNTDGSEHVEICRLLAGYGHPPTLALLREVAGADPNLYPDRQDDAKMAQAILAEATTTVVAPSKAPQVAAVAAAPQVVYVDRPVAAEPAVVNAPTDFPAAGSTGQIIGQAYDALEALQLSGALTDTEKAPLSALIAVLQTKTGASA